MKRLGILRHAKSDWDDLSQRDFDRGLNARGRRGAALMGAHIRSNYAGWDQLLASPAQRVKATLAEAALGIQADYDQSLYLADPATLLRQLRAVPAEADSVLLVGHNPGLQELALDLVAPGGENAHFSAVLMKYPTAGFAVFECDIEDWADLGAGCGRIVHFTRPRDLDPDLGPER